MRGPERTTRRVAIYTRKSVEEGLEQEFNSLDAQRESAEAYVKSQKANGWRTLPARYDDGGFSGGTTKRPALKRLLADCEAGKVDIVLVYKIDRLSRSLCDFLELIRQFEQWGVSFVSVTQEINTSTSSGRMMLNILATFSQYEREVIAERIRDKFAASKKKGMWMGGCVPLGYRVENRRLVVAPVEAATVRRIFDRYLATQSPGQVAIELNEDGLTTKGGRPWGKSNLFHILHNCTYIGKTPYKGEEYDGEHEAIVEREVWDKVQRCLPTERKAEPDLPRMEENVAPLKGLLACGHCGGPMTQYSTRKKGRKYYYYKCARDGKRAVSECPIRQVSASEVERAVFGRLAAALRHPSMLARLEEVAGENGATLVERVGPALLDEATNSERRRLAELMVERVRLFQDRMEIEVKAGGLKALKEQVENEKQD